MKLLEVERIVEKLKEVYMSFPAEIPYEYLLDMRGESSSWSIDFSNYINSLSDEQIKSMKISLVKSYPSLEEYTSAENDVFIGAAIVQMLYQRRIMKEVVDIKNLLSTMGIYLDIDY